MVDMKETLKKIIYVLAQQWKEESPGIGTPRLEENHVSQRGMGNRSSCVINS